MIIVLKPGATHEDARELMAKMESAGVKPLYLPGTERIVLGAIGDERVLEKLHLDSSPIVEKVNPILAPYKLVGRELHPHDTIVPFGKMAVGGENFSIIAGPCAVESLEQMEEIARLVRDAGATGLRGGAFKPRSSPYSFQGLGEEGLRILKQVSEATGLPTVTEVIDDSDVPIVAEHVDAMVVGARNMQNFRLLKAVGKSRRAVILKRGMSATLEEFLMAAEYIMSEGNPNIILCERGIRSYDRYSRNVLDLCAIPYIKMKSHLPIIVDPSHGTGVRAFVPPMSKAAAAVGADGIIVEVHPNPCEALSDGQQSLFPDQFSELVRNLIPFVNAGGKHLLSVHELAGERTPGHRQ
jgi:3-deoxy-7-phosphoheptulonate synthase